MRSIMMISRLRLAIGFLLFTTVIGLCSVAELLDKRLKLLAGETAIDCGTVGIREDASSASLCAEKSFSAKRAFVVRYRLQGIDSTAMVAIAGTNSGHVYAVHYDSMGWSSEGLGKAAQLLDGNHDVVEECPFPVQLTKTRSHRLTCFPPDPNPKRNIMSPTMEPY
jgi:hypothetical protein